MENTKFKYDLNTKIKMHLRDRSVDLYHVVALRDIENPHQLIKKGTVGGLCALGVLSEEGESWVADGAIVCDKNFVSGNAYVTGSSFLFKNCSLGGNAKVEYSILDAPFNMSIYGNVQVVRSNINGNLQLKDDAIIDSCNIDGRVAMEGQTKLKKCRIKTSGNGIVLAGDKKVEKVRITGNGTVGISDKVVLQEKNL